MPMSSYTNGTMNRKPSKKSLLQPSMKTQSFSKRPNIGVPSKQKSLNQRSSGSKNILGNATARNSTTGQMHFGFPANSSQASLTASRFGQHRQSNSGFSSLRPGTKKGAAEEN